MSGDVQPRKRKDKKKKKEELGIEEPSRGTSAIFGEGDVFMHSQNEHGTGGHWCAKIVFFSLLAILLTLIGLIILENRGLSELEANQVQTQYSGVLEGWLEDAPDDDHHDIHTLELKHHEEDHDDVDSGEQNELEDDEDDEHGDEDDEDEDDDSEDLENDEDEQNSQEDEENGSYEETDDQDNDDRSLEDDDDNNQNENNEEDSEQENSNEDDDELEYNKYVEESKYQSEETDNNLEDNNNDEDEDNSRENEDDDDGDEHEEDKDDESVEVEKIEQEASDEEPIKIDLPALPEEDDDDSQDDDDKDNDTEEDEIDNADDDEDDDDDSDGDDDDFLDNDDEMQPVVEHITAPAGKPFVEVDEDDSTESAPVDTLADEEEYEKRQEEIRQEQEKASHMWLKLGVGAALLVATHAVVRRATGPRDEADDTNDQEEIREETPVVDRRMTLIPEQATPAASAKTVPEEAKPNIQQEIIKKIPFIIESAPTPKQGSLQEDDIDEYENIENVDENNADDEELYSDEEVEEEEVVVEDKLELPIKTAVAEAVPVKEVEQEESEPEDDVEIIDEEQIEEEVIDEEDEEEISDVDDAELLSRLEAKYGRLPENQHGPQPKDGGNSVEDSWPGEPNDAFWREELNKAEEELRQGWME